MAEEKEKKKKPIVKKRKADKWKKKTWYQIISSKEFASKEIGTTISEKPETVVGRTLEVSVRNLAGQARKQHVTIVFKVDDVKGSKAYAKAVGHKILDSFLKKFVRNRSSKIQVTQLLSLKTGEKIRVSTITLTARKIEKNKQTAIRKIVEKNVGAVAELNDTQKIISELVFGNTPQAILSEAKKVAPVKRIEITKSRILFSK